MLVYLILANAVTQQKPWGRSSSFIGLALLGTAIALRQINLPRQSALALIGLLIYSLSAGQGGLQAALASKAMVHLGRTSYSLYISHAAVISALHVALPTYSAQHKGLAARMAIALAYLLSLAITAELAYRFIEDPARRWLRSALRPEKALTMDKGTHRDLTAAVTIDRASP
jgi:peptidoglycan/LPS O-acetylase OafA/YrhL